MSDSSQAIGMTFQAERIEGGELFVTWIVSIADVGEVFRLHMDEDLALQAARNLVAALSQGLSDHD